MTRPAVALLDVNETLSDLSGLDPVLASLGAPPGLRERWFAGVLRDGFARCVAGTAAPFADVARAGLRGVLAATHGRDGLDDAVEQVLEAFARLDVHPDVPPGVEGLAAAGIRVATLSNGGTAVADALLRRSGVREVVEEVLTVEDAPAWKPDPRAYRWATGRLGVDPADAVMVACHPWDLHGAAAAGLRTAYLDRTGAPWPEVFAAPDVVVGGLDGLVAALGS